MTWAAKSPNLFPVDTSTGGQAWMVGWTDPSSAAVPDSGDGSATIEQPLGTIRSNAVAATAGSQYVFAIGLDALDSIDGGFVGSDIPDNLDGGAPGETPSDIVSGGSPSSTPGSVVGSVVFRNASAVILAATVTRIGKLSGDRGAWLAVAPAGTATVEATIASSRGTVRLSHPVLVQSAVDPGPLDPISTPDGAAGEVDIVFSLSATATKSVDAVAIAELSLGNAGASGDEAASDASGDVSLELSIDAAAEYGILTAARTDLELMLTATAIQRPPIPVNDSAGDLRLGLRATAKPAKTGSGQSDLGVSISLSAKASAFRDEAGGAFDWQLVAYEPGNATPHILPHPLALQLSAVLSDVGALTLEYPLDGVGAEILDGYCDIEFQVRTDTTYFTPPNCRFSKTDYDSDFIDERGRRSRRYTFQSYAVKLAGVVQTKTTGLDANGERPFGNATIASIVKAIITEEKAAGNIPGLRFDNSTANTRRLPLAFEPGKDVLSILREQTDLGNCEWLIEKNSDSNEARTLTMYDTVGTDRATIANPVRLVEGIDVVSAPSRVSYQDLAAKVMVKGDGGRTVTFTNAGADMPYGAQTTVVQAGGVTELAALQIIGQARLDKGSKPRAQLTREVIFRAAQWLPFLDYGLGDKILAQDQNGVFAPLRVRAISLTMDQSGELKGILTLNDRFLEADERRDRKVKQLSGSSNATSGSGRAPIPVGDDKRQIKPPTNLAVTSVPFLDSGVPRALPTAGWINPQTATDGSPMDPSSIEVWGRPNVATEKFRRLGTVDAPDNQLTLPPVEGNSAWQFKVRAIGTNDKRSEFSPILTVRMANDTEPPPRPTRPEIATRLGTLTVIWEGGYEDGTPPADFSYLEVHASSANGFTPTAGTVKDRLTGPGRVPFGNIEYNAPRYFRFVAVDSSGNKSTPSAQATGSTTPLVDTDIIGQVIHGAKIKDGSITATDKVIARSITGALIKGQTIETGHLKANVITADKIDAGAVTGVAISATALNGKTITGALIRTSSSPSRVELNDNGVYQYRSNKMVSAITPSGFNLRSSLSGARIEVTNTGVRIYNGSGRKTVDLKSNGDALFEGSISASRISGSTITGGTIRTSTSSTRLEMTTAGLKQYKSGDVLSELTPSGGFVFRSAASGARVTISPGTGIQAFDSSGNRTVLIAVNGSASFRGTVTASRIVDGTMTGTTANGVTVNSAKGSGNNWSGGSVADANISRGSMKNTPISGGSMSNSDITNTPYSSSSSGDSIDIARGTLDSGFSRTTSLTVRSGGILIGGLAGAVTTNDRVITVRNTLGPSMSLYASRIVLQAQGSGRLIRLDTPTVNYTGTMSKTSTRASKTEIEPISLEDTLAFLSVEPVTYTPKGGGPRAVGVIAEDVDEAGLPILVTRDTEGGIAGVAYSELAPYLLAACRHLLSKLKTLESAA